MIDDRDYYRSMTNKALIEQAAYNASTELCTVLAERLAVLEAERVNEEHVKYLASNVVGAATELSEYVDG